MKENRHPIFSHYQTRPLADPNAPKTLPVSLDLGLTTTTVTRQEDGWQLPNGLILNFSQIAEINAQETSCFRLVNGKLLKVEAFSENTNRYYSLMPTAKAPSMLISGIPMHRIKGTTPVEDTDRKMRALGKPYGQILDTATGLGYTAIQAAKTAQRVFTVEFDPAVLSICQVNPWSQGLFNHPKITQIIGDSWDIASFFPDETLNAIIHDPPTFNLAGHLYSKSLYEIFHSRGWATDPDARQARPGVLHRARRCRTFTPIRF